MSRNSSVQKKLQKVRPPRVQMTYDVEIGDAIENKELPLVVGVVGDFGTNADAPQKRLKERSFVGIDRDNFDEVMNGVAPRATYRVQNELTDEGGEFAVDLTFRSMDDFRPEAVVNQVEPLRRLLEARTKLADLRNKLAGNDRLEDLLNDVLNSTETMARLGQQTTKE